jgi:hypothetical protein
MKYLFLYFLNLNIILLKWTIAKFWNIISNNFIPSNIGFFIIWICRQILITKIIKKGANSPLQIDVRQ